MNSVLELAESVLTDEGWQHLPMNTARILARSVIDLSARAGELEEDVRHWKSNHENLRQRNQVYSARQDLPFDRCEAHKLMVKLQMRVAELEEHFRAWSLKQANDSVNSATPSAEKIGER